MGCFSHPCIRVLLNSIHGLRGLRLPDEEALMRFRAELGSHTRHSAWSESCFSHLLAVWPQTRYLTSPCFIPHLQNRDNKMLEKVKWVNVAFLEQYVIYSKCSINILSSYYYLSLYTQGWSLPWRSSQYICRVRHIKENSRRWITKCAVSTKQRRGQLSEWVLSETCFEGWVRVHKAERTGKEFPEVECMSKDTAIWKNMQW